VTHDSRFDLTDVINQIIREGNKTNISQSICSENINSDNGHLIISLKFFKFVTEDDVNSEQRVRML
jgi:hypothetical protein